MRQGDKVKGKTRRQEEEAVKSEEAKKTDPQTLTSRLLVHLSSLKVINIQPTYPNLRRFLPIDKMLQKSLH